MIHTKKIIIDLARPYVNDNILLHEGDVNGSALSIDVYNNGEAFDLTGFTVEYDATIAGYLAEMDAAASTSDNTITVPVKETMTAYSGLLKIDVKICKNSEVLFFRTIKADVQKRVITDSMPTPTGEKAVDLLKRLIAGLDDKPSMPCVQLTGNNIYPNVNDAVEGNVVYRVFNSRGGPDGWLIFCGSKNYVDVIVSQFYASRTGEIKYRTGTANNGTVTWDIEWKEISSDIDLSDYVTDSDLSAALISKEDTANKVATITFGNQESETLFPTVGATASYIGALTGSLSPQSYGAKANGVDDDTSALQAVLDAAALKKKAVFLYGTYKITAPLSVPDNSVIIGSGKYGAAINSSSSSVFTSLNYVKISNIYFTNNSSETASFMSGQATQITMTDCTVRGYDNVFAGGIKTLSRIERNSFSGIKKQFAAYVTDSSVTKNYINASKTGFGSTVAFTGSLNNAVIDGNYIDFWTVVFTSVDGKVSTISNNIIDDCYTVFFQRAVNLAIVSNTFSNIEYVEKNWKSGTTYYVPQQYRDIPWTIFRFNYSSDEMIVALLPEGKRTSLFHDITFTANSLDSGVDYLIYLQRDSNDKPTVIQYPIYSIRICANSIYPSTLCEFRGLRSKLKAYDYYGNEVSVNMKNVYIETLDRKYYDTLPNPTQSAESSSDPIVTYDGQQAYYQKRLVTNIDGDWYYADGTKVSDNVVYAKLSDIPEKVSELQNDSGYLTQHQDISGKVDKVEGKGLSTNDYTTTEKNKLGGIETGANKTVVDSALSSTSTNPVQNKVIKKALDDLPAVPTKVSELTNDSGYLTLGTLPVYNGGVQ